ncbi:unnamed protein product [Heterotrigona itama]|uniref:Uncharacterized protein n=1 Tax=Heterotrigona itama TaxID=395501 RepID=A0A6V7H887_9HYME|nr:unnamed protein product [Heterotrigona itama]
MMKIKIVIEMILLFGEMLRTETSLNEKLLFIARNLFFTDILLETIVLETNKYANNKIEQQSLSERSIWNNWVDVTKEE